MPAIYLNENMDKLILLWANGHYTDALDTFMTIFTHRFAWIPLYIAIAYAVVKTLGWQRGLVYILAVAAAIVCADQLCGSVIRPAVGRLRPTNPDNPLSEMIHIVNGYRGGRYGMPSCHAANTAAFLTIITLRFRHRWLTAILAIWMLGQCYSRMYLGVHYPSDLLVGATLGTLCSVAVFFAYRIICQRIFSEKPERVCMQSVSVPLIIILLSLTVMTSVSLW